MLTAPSLAAAFQAKPKNMTEEAWVQELNDCILKVWCTLWWGSFSRHDAGAQRPAMPALGARNI